MRSWIARRMLRRANQRYGYDTRYLELMLKASPSAFFKFAALNKAANHREVVPVEASFAVKICGAMAEDCGPCTQLVVDMALEAGMARPQIEAVVRRDPRAMSAATALAFRFADAVARRTGNDEEYREAVRAQWGDKGVIDLAMAMQMGGNAGGPRNVAEVEYSEGVYRFRLPLSEFKSGQIAGGSEPAPYDIQMVQDGGTVLLSEPGVTTLLIVTKSFLSAHPAVVSDLLKAQVQANAFIKSNPTQAQADANAELATYTGKSLKPDLVAASFKEITFTNDPNAASLKTAADQAVALGLLKPVNLDGIYALDPLNKVLAAAGESQISS
jgi:hypothetical protein